GRPTRVESDVAAFFPPELLKSLPECGEERRSFQIVLGIAHQHGDPPHPLGLLRACNKRPRGRSATNHFDEITPSHGRPTRLRQGLLKLADMKSKADIRAAKSHVRFRPNSDRKSEFPQKVESALLPKADISP